MGLPATCSQRPTCTPPRAAPPSCCLHSLTRPPRPPAAATAQELWLPSHGHPLFSLKKVLAVLPTLRSLAIGNGSRDRVRVISVRPAMVVELINGPWLRTQLRRLELRPLSLLIGEGPLLEACAGSDSLRELAVGSLCSSIGGHAAVLSVLSEWLERLEVRAPRAMSCRAIAAIFEATRRLCEPCLNGAECEPSH